MVQVARRQPKTSKLSWVRLMTPPGQTQQVCTTRSTTSSSKMKLKINQAGEVRAVYSDRLPGLALGPMEMTRASNVEFNHTTQEWEAHTPEGELIAKGQNRNAVISQEVKVIESRL